MKTAYIDCFSGISGDMFLGALLDAGLPFEELKRSLQTLPIDHYSIEAKKEARNGITGTRFVVDQEQKARHPHRGLKEIREIIERGDLSNEVKGKSLSIFRRIAVEEGKIHGYPEDEIHFHEVGAIDSIIDIVGTCFGMEFLGLDAVYSSRLPMGSGFIESGHGRIPLPAPATTALLKGVPVYDSGLEVELVTPTGAALISEFACSFGAMPSMTIDVVGYGAGSRILPDRPNLLRILIGKEETVKGAETVVVLDANLDDTNPEWLGFLMERLFDAGALDVAFSPVQMKKNRPGVQIQVIGRPYQKDALMDIIFAESTTLGIRFTTSQRRILERARIEIESPWGKMAVKKVIGPDGSPVLYPEYDVCRSIAMDRDIPVRDIYYWIQGKNSGLKKGDRD
ncbi:MAG: nickel pincer cofactor biosynthesis protein LarC [Deltaproteobacteria bacterium]|nr:nickel pincer cofactor biosynthesis protein LarC [Deltaproteobacteria bacterium]